MPLRHECKNVKIAIVGAGISGLTAAHLLHREHDVTVFEAGDHAGGHTNTVRVELPPREGVDPAEQNRVIEIVDETDE